MGHSRLADYDFHTDTYLSGAIRAIVNHRSGIDLLVARDEVDADRSGVIGHSLGGHNAMFVGAFDERIQAVVSSCGWDPFNFSTTAGSSLVGPAIGTCLESARATVLIQVKCLSIYPK